MLKWKVYFDLLFVYEVELPRKKEGFRLYSDVCVWVCVWGGRVCVWVCLYTELTH